MQQLRLQGVWIHTEKSKLNTRSPSQGVESDGWEGGEMMREGKLPPEYSVWKYFIFRFLRMTPMMPLYPGQWFYYAPYDHDIRSRQVK